MPADIPLIREMSAYNNDIMSKRSKILSIALHILTVSSCATYKGQSVSLTSTPYEALTQPSPALLSSPTKEFTSPEHIDIGGGRFITYTPTEIDLVDPIQGTTSKIKSFQEPLNLIALSPDGNRLAYLLNNSVLIEDIASHSINDLVENQIGSVGRRMGWSPDGSMIVLTCATPSHPTSEICLVNATNGDVRTVTNSKELGISNPYDFVGFESWNHEGSAIAFTLNRTPPYGGEEKNDIYFLDLITGKINLIVTSETQSNILSIGWLSIAPDDKTILFHGKINGNFQIFQINIDGSGLRQITDETGYDVTNPVWNPNGTLFSGFLSSPHGQLPGQAVIFDLSGRIVHRLDTSGFVMQWLK